MGRLALRGRRLSITFQGIAITVNAENQLVFDSSGLPRTERGLAIEHNTFNALPNDLNDDFLGGMDSITDITPGAGEPRRDFSTPSGWVTGGFVGQDADGPTGMIGTWAIGGNTFNDNQPFHCLSTGNTGPRHPAHGTFGADIAP